MAPPSLVASTPASQVIHRLDSPAQAICRVCRAPGLGAGTSMRSRRQVVPPSRVAQTNGAPSWVPQPATQACRESPAATLVSTVMGNCLRSRHVRPPSRVLQILSSAISTPWRASEKATSARRAPPKPVRCHVLPPSAVRKTDDAPGSPAAPVAAPTIQACPGVHGGDRLDRELDLADDGPAGAAVHGLEHRAGVGRDPSGLRVRGTPRRRRARGGRTSGGVQLAPPSAVTSRTPVSPAAQARTPAAGAGGSPKGWAGACVPPLPQPARSASATSTATSDSAARGLVCLIVAPGPPGDALSMKSMPTTTAAVPAPEPPHPRTTRTTIRTTITMRIARATSRRLRS